VQRSLSVRVDDVCFIRKKGIAEFKNKNWTFRTFGPPYIPKQEDKVSCGLHLLCLVDLLT
jgi:hypothetical protein